MHAKYSTRWNLKEIWIVSKNIPSEIKYQLSNPGLFTLIRETLDNSPIWNPNLKWTYLLLEAVTYSCNSEVLCESGMYRKFCKSMEKLDLCVSYIETVCFIWSTTYSNSTWSSIIIYDSMRIRINFNYMKKNYWNLVKVS